MSKPSTSTINREVKKNVSTNLTGIKKPVNSSKERVILKSAGAGMTSPDLKGEKNQKATGQKLYNSNNTNTPGSSLNTKPSYINKKHSSSIHPQPHKRNKSVNSLGLSKALLSNKTDKRNLIRPETSLHSYINTDPDTGPRSKFYSQSISEPVQNNPNNDNPPSDPVQHYLMDSLKIINKIRENFEMSAENNKLENNLLYKRVMNTESNPKRSFNSAQNLLQNQKFLTNIEKEIITNHISSSSDQRMKNYSNLFSVINDSLADIKDHLLIYNLQLQEEKDCIRKRGRHSVSRYSLNEKEMNRIKNNLGLNRININLTEPEEENPYPTTTNRNTEFMFSPKPQTIPTQEDVTEFISSDEEGENQCDFSESMMLENAFVLLPKLTNVHQLNTLQLKELIRRETKKKKLRTMKSSKSNKGGNTSNSKTNNQGQAESLSKQSTIKEYDLNDKEKDKDKTVIEFYNITTATSSAATESTTIGSSNDEEKKCIIY